MIKTPGEVKTYRKDLKRALSNKFLGATLDAFATACPASRANAFSGIDFDALADEIAREKDQYIPRLEELLEEFTARRKAGAVVDLPHGFRGKFHHCIDSRRKRGKADRQE